MGRLLAEVLVDPYSPVRYIAGHSITRLPGLGDFAYDYIGPAAERTQARQRALDSWSNQRSNNGNAMLPARSDSLLSDGQIADMLRQRDNRHMELQE